MTLEFEETISEDRLEQGEILQNILNDLETEKKNAIIGFRCVNKEVPESLDNEDLQWVDFKSSIDTLAEMGVCHVDEEEMQELLRDFKQEVGELYSDHRAWSILTVLEIEDYKDPDEAYLESNIYSNESKVNPSPIDLVCKSDNVSLVTCKFNISTQGEEARNKANELDEVVGEVEEDLYICLGTLNPKVKERIEHQFDSEFDEIISGVDVLSFGG